MKLTCGVSLLSLDSINSLVSEDCVQSYVQVAEDFVDNTCLILQGNGFYVNLKGCRVLAFEYKEKIYICKNVLEYIDLSEIKNFFGQMKENSFTVDVPTLRDILHQIYLLDETYPGEGISTVELSEYLEKIPAENRDVIVDKNFFSDDIFQMRVFNHVKYYWLIKQEVIREGLARIEKLLSVDKRLTKILFLSFKCEWHEDVWNTLSIESLAGHLYGEFGKEIEITAYRIADQVELRQCIEKIAEGNFQFIGISLEIGTERYLDEFCKKISEIYKIPQIVLGGVLISHYPDYFVERDYFKKFKMIGMLGEGEDSWCKLVRYQRGEISLDAVSNLIYCAGKNEIHNTFREELDEKKLIHPPTMYTVSAQRTNILQFSRGCIFSCHYCSQGPNKRWRPLPLNRCVANLCALARKNVCELEFVDDEFLGGRSENSIRRLRDIVTFMRNVQAKYRIQFSFRIFTNPLLIWRENDEAGNVIMRALLVQLKEVGLTRIYLGTESGSDEQRKRYNRKESIRECEESIRLLRELEIESDVGFIMFDPEMTVKDIRENVSFFVKNELILANTWPFRPLIVTRNVPIYWRLKQKGLLKESSDMGNLLSVAYKFEDSDVSQIYEIVDKLAKTSDKLFYNIKYLTKRHNNNVHSHGHLLCWEYVRNNAQIYLCLLEKLSTVKSQEEQAAAEKEALCSLNQLVTSISINITQICKDDKDKESLLSSLLEAQSNIENYYTGS